MREVEFNGVKYRSLRAACLDNGITYYKVARLVRHYKCFRSNIAGALSFAKENDKGSLKSNVKTDAYLYDRAVTRLRVRDYRFRKKIANSKALISMMYLK